MFCYFFKIFNYVSGRNTSERFFFSIFLSLSHPILAWEEAMMVYSNLLKFFAIFLEFSITVRVGTHRNDFLFLFFIFLSLPHPILAWEEAMMVFSNFLNFFAILLEFPIPGRVETYRNDFYYFLSFSAFPILFWLEMKLWLCFLIFWIFLVFLFNFFYYGLARNTLQRFLLFSLFLCLSHSILAWKEATLVFSNFLNFFAIFF